MSDERRLATAGVCRHEYGRALSLERQGVLAVQDGFRDIPPDQLGVVDDGVNRRRRHRGLHFQRNRGNELIPSPVERPM